MPLVKLDFAPGLQKDETPLASEGGWIDGDKVRFVRGRPQTVGGWETVILDEFDGIARGAHAWADLTGRRYFAFGTATHLYAVIGGELTDITPAGLTAGLVDGIGEPGGYGTGEYGEGGYGGSLVTSTLPRVWFLANWGEKLLALPRGGSLYEWDPPVLGGTPGVATVVTGAPTQSDAMFVSPERICVLMGTSLFGGSYGPLNVRWCDQEDLTDWTPAPDNLSGDYVLSEGSRAVGGIVTRQQNLCWTDSALYSMSFTGDASSVYSFRLIATGCGLAGALAATEFNGTAYWMSRDNFYAFGGGAPQIIPSTLRRDVFDNVAENQGEKTVAWVNPGFGEVSWSYADERDGNEVSRYATFAIGENHWTAGTFDRSSWIEPGLYEFPIGFGTDGGIYFHEKGQSANGGVIDAWLEGAYFDIGDGENMVHVRRIVPDFEDLQGPVIFTLTGKSWPNGTEMNFGPYQHSSATTDLPMRMTARQVKVRMDTTSSPAFWRMGALKFDVVQGGARR